MTAADHICHNPDEALLDAVTELHGLLEYLGGERRGDVEGITSNATVASVNVNGSGSGVAATVPVSTRRTRSNSVMTVDSVQSQGQGLGPGQQISQARKKQKVMGGGGEENDDDVTYWQEAPSPSLALLLSSTTALGTRRPRSSLQTLLQDILVRHAAKGQGLAGEVNTFSKTGKAASSSSSAIAADIQASIVPSRLSAAVLAFYATNLTPIIPSSSSSSSIDGVSALIGGRQGHGWFSINGGALLRKVWCDVAYLHLLPLHQRTSTKGNPPPLNTTGAVGNAAAAMKWIVMCASLDMACLSIDSQSTAPSSSSSSLSSDAVDVTPHLVELEQKGALLVQVLRLLELLINVVSLSSSTSASSSAVQVQKFQPLLSYLFIRTFSSHLLNPFSQPNLNPSFRLYHP